MIGLWAAMLLFLPDAPRATAQQAPRTGAAGQAPPAPAIPTAVRVPAGAPLIVPVEGEARETVRDSWGDPRENGLRLHHGTDIMAPRGTPVIAAAPGTIEKLWTSAAGGLTLYERSPARDLSYYYAHLSGYAPGLHEGQVVRAGELLGYVGDTGNAGAGNYHLHFGMVRTRPEQHWYEGEDVNPYPYLAGGASRR